MGNFDLAYVKTGKNEGGYANVEGDAGGETYGGISRKFFPNWPGWKYVDAAKPLKHNQSINDPHLEVLKSQFYKEHFWDVIGGDQIEDQDTCERLYDFGVTSGQSRSLKQIQEVLGIAQTGKADTLTLDAINNPAKYLV